MLTNARKQLIEVLGVIQNTPECCNQDIMTFSAFLDDEELRTHILSNFRRVKGVKARTQLVARTRAILGPQLRIVAA